MSAVSVVIDGWRVEPLSPQTWEVWDLGREKKLCTIRPDEGFGSFSGSLSPDGRFVVGYAHREGLV